MPNVLGNAIPRDKNGQTSLASRDPLPWANVEEQQPTPGSITNHTTKQSQNRSQYTIPMATAPRLGTTSGEQRGHRARGAQVPRTRPSHAPSSPMASPGTVWGRTCGSSSALECVGLCSGPVFPVSPGMRLGARPTDLGIWGVASPGDRVWGLTGQDERSKEPRFYLPTPDGAPPHSRMGCERRE